MAAASRQSPAILDARSIASLLDDRVVAVEAARAALALLAELQLDDAVAAVRRDGARRGALPRAVGGGGVHRAVVALLGAAHGAVAAVRRQRAIRIAGAVGPVIGAVVALLVAVLDAVAA